MATAPQANALPMLYRDLVPLSSQEHGDWRARQMTSLAMLRGVHALPVTVDEFVLAQRSLPIIFSVGDEPVPLVLMGLSEGQNLLLDEAGFLPNGVYLPAYARRFPFLLARLTPDSDELSLCFDPTPDLLGPFDEGVPIFTDGQPSPDIAGTLEFCREYEVAMQRTGQFVRDLQQLDLLTDGEVTITPPDAAQPFVYRGFRIVNEEKLRDLRGDQLRRINQSGMLPLIHAHLFSLAIIRELFERQYRPAGQPAAPGGAPDLPAPSTDALLVPEA